MQEHDQNNKEKGIQKRKNQFRKRIRRQQIDKYFQQRRKEILSQNGSSSEYIIKQQLQSIQGRSQFLKTVNQKLLQTAPNKWKHIIQQIIIAMAYFNGEFDQWVQTTILDSLATTMKSQMAQYGYQHLIMKIFTSILIHIKDTPSNLVNHIIKTLIIQNTVLFMKIVELPLEYQLDFFYFLSSFCRINYKIRNFILQIGTGELLERFGRKILLQNNFNQQMRYNYLGICTDFLKIFDNKKQPCVDFVLTIMPIIFDLVEARGSDRIINIGLISLLIILRTRKQIFYTKFISHPVLQNLFNLAKNPLFYKISLNIMSFLASSESNKIVQLLVKLGIKDLLYQANCQIVNYQFMILTLSILDHLTSTQAEVEHLINHKIWNVACNALVYNHAEVRYEAYQFINAIMVTIDAQNLKLAIFKQNNFIDLVISQIEGFKKWPDGITLQALNLLTTYIMLQSQSRNFQSFHIFESVYRLSQILQRIAIQSPNNEIIDKANTLYNIYIQNYMDNCTN